MAYIIAWHTAYLYLLWSFQVALPVVEYLWQTAQLALRSWKPGEPLDSPLLLSEPFGALPLWTGAGGGRPKREETFSFAGSCAKTSAADNRDVRDHRKTQ